VAGELAKLPPGTLAGTQVRPLTPIGNFATRTAQRGEVGQAGYCHGVARGVERKRAGDPDGVAEVDSSSPRPENPRIGGKDSVCEAARIA
jgi:hypothetical protein